MKDRLVVPCAFKAIADGDAPRTFEGYASVFDGVDSYRDSIARGAFKGSLKDWKAKGKLPKMLLQHGGGFFGGSASDLVPVGKWTDMREDDTGLFAKGFLFEAGSALVYDAMKAGELDGLSIGFRTRKSKMDEETGIRTLTEIDLWEVSVVTFPADDAARIAAVKFDGELPSERAFERWLHREGGFTQEQARAITAKGYRQVQREAASEQAHGGELAALLRQRVALYRGDQPS